jgi:hypothetical protein
MIDPLSITGVTLAVTDALLKLGERTAVLISDAAAFEDVSNVFSIALPHAQ